MNWIANSVKKVPIVLCTRTPKKLSLKKVRPCQNLIRDVTKTIYIQVIQKVIILWTTGNQKFLKVSKIPHWPYVHMYQQATYDLYCDKGLIWICFAGFRVHIQKPVPNNLPHSRLLQKSSVSKFVNRIAKSLIYLNFAFFVKHCWY
jgi:hypothetical protein